MSFSLVPLTERPLATVNMEGSKRGGEWRWVKMSEVKEEQMRVAECSHQPRGFVLGVLAEMTRPMIRMHLLNAVTFYSSPNVLWVPAVSPVSFQGDQKGLQLLEAAKSKPETRHRVKATGRADTPPYGMPRPVMAPGCINQIAVGKRFIACAVGKASWTWEWTDGSSRWNAIEDNINNFITLPIQGLTHLVRG